MRHLAFLVVWLLLFWPLLARADLVIVAGAHSGIDRLTHDQVVNIYLGRYRLLASGIGAEPIDITSDGTLRSKFYRQLVNKSLAEINAYWSRLIFSGKTRPPRAVENVEEALRLVSSQAGALAYVERSQADRSVKIVFEFGE